MLDKSFYIDRIILAPEQELSQRTVMASKGYGVARNECGMRRSGGLFTGQLHSSNVHKPQLDLFGLKC
jgi:hypothetical protein